MITPPHPQSISAPCDRGTRTGLYKPEKCWFPHSKKQWSPSTLPQPGRQPDSGPGLLTNITTQESLLRSPSPPEPPPESSYFKGLPTGVAACHRGPMATTCAHSHRKVASLSRPRSPQVHVPDPIRALHPFPQHTKPPTGQGPSHGPAKPCTGRSLSPCSPHSLGRLCTDPLSFIKKGKSTVPLIPI